MAKIQLPRSSIEWFYCTLLQQNFSFKNHTCMPFSHWPSSCTDVFLYSCWSGTWETVSLRFY